MTMKLVKANHFCRSQLNKNQVKQSHYYNKTVHEISLEVGLLVWLFTPAWKKELSRKLSSPWSGPYEIVKKLSDITFRIKLVNGGKLSVVRVNRLRPVKPHTFCSSELPDHFQEPMVSKDVETRTDISEALPENPDTLPKEDEPTKEQEHEESKESERDTTHHSKTQKILRRSKHKVQLPNYLNDSSEKPSLNDISPYSHGTKQLIHHWEQLCIMNRVLYKKWETDNGQDE